MRLEHFIGHLLGTNEEISNFRDNLMRHLYNLLLYLASPFILLRLLWKAYKNPAYAERLTERFGFVPSKIKGKGYIWIHAVSVGEVVASTPLIKILQKTYPNIPLLITTMTPTGAERVQTLFANTVTHLYLPYDFPGAIKRFVKSIKPRFCILMETELWPNLLHTCYQQKIPVILANARLSARSATAYLRVAKLTHSLLQSLSQVFAQTTADAERFIQLGVNPNNISVTGSLKFDLELPLNLNAKAKQLRQLWGKNRFIWIAASTHEHEESLILQAFATVKKSLPQTLLVLAPRHPERFQKVAALCRKQGYTVMLRSENVSCSDEIDIVIGDTMGELLCFYAAADIAYVGGSLVPKGGQNPLEPAAIGTPILTGPHTFNFAAINEALQIAGIAIKVLNIQELAQHVIQLLQDPIKRQQMGQQGKTFFADNRGALEKQFELIKPFFEN
jgi:3-deoxy-D-manno-octulosonic-acid transferase